MAFLDDNFLLSNDVAVRLYHDYASRMPIYDYHCHIDAKDIYEDKRFSSITELWLSADHYKWRIMRSNGIEEKYITGDASDYDKFCAFARTLPRCIGNPMYHWCHLELKNYFGYNGVLDESTADEVWALANDKLKDKSFTARELIKRSNVAMIGTTDDPCSDLVYHTLIKASDFGVAVCPTFRPDKAIDIHKDGFREYIAKLSSVSGIAIHNVADVKKALTKRLEFFVSVGARASDHGLDYIMFRQASEQEIDEVFAKAMRGEELTQAECEIYATDILLHCAKQYARLGVVMQLHFSCMRNPNTRMHLRLGADAGFDSIAVTDSSRNLYALLDELEQSSLLPRTILYSLNPADNEWIDTLIGAFQDSSTRGKIQHGSAWWFNDNKRGIMEQLESLANLSILGNFIGMLTDSRSLVSYTRHEYFRRILCDFVGTLIANGEYPNDVERAGAIIQDVCANNAKEYFNL